MSISSRGLIAELQGLSHTFSWRENDDATYSLRDNAGAVRHAGQMGTIALDIETEGLGVDRWKIKAVSIGTANRSFVLDPESTQGWAAIRDALIAARVIVLHNSTFDVPPLVVSGLMPLDCVDKVVDTLVTARLVEPSERVRKGLGDACERFLDAEYGQWKTSLEEGYKAVTGKSKKEMFKELGLDSPAYVAYAGMDVIMTVRLLDVLRDALAARLSDHPYSQSHNGDPDHLINREQVVNRMLLKRSCIGLIADFDVIDQLKGEMASVVAECDQQLSDFGIDVTASAPKMKEQFMEVLEARRILPASYPRKKDGAPSADKRYLDRISHPIVDAMGLRSQAERFAKDYADKIIHSSINGRIHPEVTMLAARTGRMSMSDPPLQQYPPSVRRMLGFDVPATSLDWSSIEPVYVAYAAQEAALLAEYEAGADLYLPVAEAAGVSRKLAKEVLLAQFYGRGAPSLAIKLGVTEQQAAELIRSIMSRMPNIAKMLNILRGVGNNYGKVLTMSGRVLPIDPDPRSGNTRYLGFKGVNYTIQGSCYDLLSEALLAMHQAGLDDALFIALHDEIVCAAEAADDVQRIMQTPPPAFIEAVGRVPILRTGRAELGRYWAEKEQQ